MTFYRHVLTVTVVTPECDPDVVEKDVEAAIREEFLQPVMGESVYVAADPMNRLSAPACQVSDSPILKTWEDMRAFSIAKDAWLETVPTAHPKDASKFL